MRQIFLNPLILIALLSVSLVYLFFLLLLGDHKKYRLSLRWLVTFLFLFTGLNLTIPPFVYLYPEALAGFDKTLDSALLQIGIYIGIMLILRNWFASFLKSCLSLLKNPFLFLFIIYASISALWSETPDVSLRAGLVIFFTSLFSAHIAKEYSFKALAVILRRLVLFVAVVSVAIAPVAKSLVFNEKGFSGILPFPIKLGTLLAFGATLWLLYLFENKEHRWKTIGIVLFLSLMITATNSAQSIFTYFTLFTFVVLLKVLTVFGMRYVPVMVLSYLMLSIINSIFVDSYLPKIFDALGKDMTLTGRTDFWPQLIERLGQHNLLLGYGVNSFWQPWRGSANPASGILNSDGFVPPHAHNGFIDLALSVGLIGFVLFAFSFLVGLIQAVKCFLQNKSPDASVPLIILLYLVFANISETQLLGSNYIWILYVITLTRLNVKQKEIFSSKYPVKAISTVPSFQHLYADQSRDLN